MTVPESTVALLTTIGFQVRLNPFVPWPGCVFGRTIFTPDPTRLLAEIELIAVGNGPLLVRLEGPLSPAMLPWLEEQTP